MGEWRDLTVAKLYYFAFFAAIGCLMPYFNVFLERRGMSGAQIGWLAAVPPLVALAAAPVWGIVSDRWRIHRPVMAGCAVLAGLLTPLFLVVDGFWQFMALVILAFFFRTPLMSLADSAVMGLVKRTGRQYGRLRAWGTVGFVFATLGLGRMLTTGDLSAAFWLYSLLIGAGCGTLALLMPLEKVTGSINIRAGIRSLASNRSYVTFLTSIALLGMASAGFFNFLGLHILALGGNESHIGPAFAANGIMEIPVMYFGARWLGRYSNNRLIVSSAIGYVLVWFSLGLAATPVAVIAIAPLVGACYAVHWMAVVGYAAETAPSGMSATAQTLVGAAQFGLGWSLGAITAGYVWAWAGGQALLFGAAALAALATVVFWHGNVLSEDRTG
jgi:MFS family permease